MTTARLRVRPTSNRAAHRVRTHLAVAILPPEVQPRNEADDGETDDLANDHTADQAADAWAIVIGWRRVVQIAVGLQVV